MRGRLVTVKSWAKIWGRTQALGRARGKASAAQLSASLCPVSTDLAAPSFPASEPGRTVPVTATASLTMAPSPHLPRPERGWTLPSLAGRGESVLKGAFARRPRARARVWVTGRSSGFPRTRVSRFGDGGCSAEPTGGRRPPPCSARSRPLPSPEPPPASARRMDKLPVTPPRPSAAATGHRPRRSVLALRPLQT